MSLWVKLFAEWGTSVRLGHSQCCWLSSLENPAQPVETEREEIQLLAFQKDLAPCISKFLVYLSPPHLSPLAVLQGVRSNSVLKNQKIKKYRELQRERQQA